MMKASLILLALFVAMPINGNETPQSKSPSEIIQSGLKVLNNFIKAGKIKSIDSDLIQGYVELDDSENKNLILKVFGKALKGLLEKPIVIEKIAAGESFALTNAAITGLEKSYVKLSSGKTGLDIQNLTIAVPEVLAEADEYKLHNLNLGVVILDGIGKLRITIQEFKFATILTMGTDVNSNFVLKTLSLFDLNAKSSHFELENLGGSTEEISNLLNGIAEKVLPKLLRSLSNDIADIIAGAGGDCNSSDLELFCSLIAFVLTNVKNSL